MIMVTISMDANAEIRKFMTLLFIERARRHLRTLATEYGWSPQVLAENEARFIKHVDMIPTWL